ncbi:MAG: hypothetical protein LBM38_06470 [Clostridiales bacterium]|jgi:hypothetical protein|nr:hypothetical protein [Clostridiales bacterium]
MMNYLLFNEIFLKSLADSKDAYNKANALDAQNGGVSVDFDSAYNIAFNYVITNRRVDYFSMKDCPLSEFIENTLELAAANTLPADMDCLYDTARTDISKDFAKKSFLLALADSVKTQINS